MATVLSESEFIKVELDAGVAVIHLMRPPMNALQFANAAGDSVRSALGLRT